MNTMLPSYRLQRETIYKPIRDSLISRLKRADQLIVCSVMFLVIGLRRGARLPHPKGFCTGIMERISAERNNQFRRSGRSLVENIQ